VTWPAALRAASPGPGSAAALREAGVARVVEPAADAPQFDSESLWDALRGDAWRGVRVLVVRGDGGRDWLAERLREAGAEVSFVQAYRRALPARDAGARALLAAAPARPEAWCWHFSSSQAIDHLQQLAPHADWSRARACASHPRIAERARALGFGRVDEVATLDALAAALQHGDLQSRAP
jgi:uroporphyrinogen-III synthase